ncbi:MAG: peptidyl-prolyl cis-trans isomerase [Pseudomonadota bacterium]
MAKSNTRNFFVWIILGLLFFGLVGFGATGLSGTIRTVGDVGEKPISTSTYAQELDALIRQRSAMLGRPITFGEAETARLPERALANVVATRAIDNEALQMGISVGDEIISQRVLAEPAFRGTDGTFSTERYREVLARSGISVREYETSLREITARDLLQTAVVGGLPDASAFGTALAGYTREGRTFTWAPLSADDLELTLPEPSEEDLQAHYDANPALYTSLETRALRYVWLTPAMIADDMVVSEDELREEYQTRIDEFVQAERRLVERLVFSTDEAAADALAAIEAGETTFPDLVAERGLDLDAVDIGDVTEAEMGEAGPAIFALDTGEVTGPFPSELGPALFRMNAILAARETTFEEALPDLREDEALQRALRLIDDQASDINDRLAGGTPLDALADQTALEFGTLDWTAEVTDGIAAYASFREAVADLDENDFPTLIQLDDGGIFAVEIDEIHPPALIPLEDTRDAVVAGWEAEARAEAVLAEADALQSQLSETVSDFSALGLEAVQDTNRTRIDFVAGTPPEFLTEVFEMEIGDVRVVPNGPDAIIVRLDDIAAADTSNEAFAAEQASLAELAADGIAEDIFQIYGRAVQLRTDVNINAQAINAVHANFR